MITVDQAEAIEAAANALISCFWSSDGLDYRLVPSDDNLSIATLDVRDMTGHTMTFAVLAVWVEGGDLHISTNSGFWLVIITEEGGEE